MIASILPIRRSPQCGPCPTDTFRFRSVGVLADWMAECGYDELALRDIPDGVVFPSPHEDHLIVRVPRGVDAYEELAAEECDRLVPLVPDHWEHEGRGQGVLVDRFVVLELWPASVLAAFGPVLPDGSRRGY